MQEKDYEVRICCSRKNQKRLREDCKEEFLIHHKSHKGLKLNDNFLLNEVINLYLKQYF